MQNLDAIWTALDDLAIELARVDPNVAKQMLAKNRDHMLTYQHLFTQMSQMLASQPQAQKGSAKEKAEQKHP